MIGLQEAPQDTRIKDSIVGHDNTIGNVRCKDGPQSIEFRFMFYLVRRNAVDVDVFRRKDHKGRLNEAVCFVNGQVIVLRHCRQGAGTIGVFIGCFKINSRKV